MIFYERKLVFHYQSRVLHIYKRTMLKSRYSKLLWPIGLVNVNYWWWWSYLLLCRCQWVLESRWRLLMVTSSATTLRDHRWCVTGWGASDTWPSPPATELASSTFTRRSRRARRWRWSCTSVISSSWSLLLRWVMSSTCVDTHGKEPDLCRRRNIWLTFFSSDQSVCLP